MKEVYKDLILKLEKDKSHNIKEKIKSNNDTISQMLMPLVFNLMEEKEKLLEKIVVYEDFLNNIGIDLKEINKKIELLNFIIQNFNNED